MDDRYGLHELAASIRDIKQKRMALNTSYHSYNKELETYNNWIVEAECLYKWALVNIKDTPAEEGERVRMR